MVFAVQCPNPKCKKYMLVEDHQQDKIVPCLLCRTPIKVGAAAPLRPGIATSGKSGKTGE